MGQNNKLIWGLVALLIIIGVVWGLNRQAPDSSEVVKIGVITPLSGDAAAYGDDIQKILEYRVEQINSERGTKFSLIFEDGKCSGSDSVSAFQKLKDVDGVKFIIGGTCSSETLGIAPLTKDGGVVTISPSSSNPDIEGVSPYTFTLSYSDKRVGETLAEQMKNFSRVAIITEQNDYNVGIKNVWESKIAEYPSVNLVANETFTKGGSDFRSVLAKVRKANPEAILLNPNVGATAENLLKQLAEIKDWTNYKVYTQFAYLADEARSAVGDFVNGMIIVDAPDLTATDFLAYKSEIEAAKGPIPTIGNYYTASTIDALDLFASLVRKNGNDAKAIRDALSDGRFHGYLGDIYFGGKSFKQGSMGGIYIVENGKAVYQQ